MGRPVAGWRAYYTLDRVFDSSETDWEALPRTGVLGVVVYHDRPYRTLVTGGDWYYRDETGSPTHVPTHPEWGKWADPPDVPHEECKRGAGVTKGEYEAVHERMMEADTWP